jgi:type I restriction enzyme S subunit
MRDGWVETTFGEAVVINPEAAKGMADDDEIVYVDLSSVSAESGISSNLYRGSFGEAPGRARRVIRTQDVLVSTVRPYLRGFALVPEFLDGEIASTGFAVLRAKPTRILPGLVWAIVGMNNFVDYLMDRATGSSYPAVRPEDISSFTFCLPPLVEQKRIVDVVASVDAYVDALQKQADSARAARNAVLHELLSAGGDGWTETTLGGVAVFYNGKAYKQDELLAAGRYRVLRVGNFFSNGNWYWSDLELDANKYCDNGDLLYAWSASFGPRIWTDEKVIYHYHIWKVEENPLLVEKKFLYYWLEDDVQRMKRDAGTGSIMMHITKGEIEARAVVLPPIEEQKRIVEIVSSMDDLIQSTEQAVVDAKNLRSGLLSDLLSGDHEIPASYDSFLGAA